MANYRTEMFDYAHLDLAAPNPHGLSSKEDHGTSHCNTKSNKTSLVLS